MRNFLFIGVILIQALPLLASNTLFEQANKAYQEEDFLKAVELYDSIAAQGEVSAALYYNLGNAHYENGALAKAILNYERALRLDPKDEEILHNLALAKSKRIDRFEEMPQNLFKAFRLSVLQLFQPDNWARLALGFLALALAGLALYLFSSYGRIGFVSLLGGSLLSLFSLIMAYSHQHYREEHPGLIIMSDSAYVKSGPGSEAEDLFILHAGTKGEQLDHFEGWTKLRLIDGKIGWLPDEDIEQIP
tara:strand:+ start:559 stop:1302 length:744 start_codon:yes stop_codon:yes gene_type:complete